jgi:predicted DNA-binding transcriptional regulator AlpA
MEKITFENMPMALTFLIGEVADLKALLLKQKVSSDKEDEEFLDLKKCCQITGYSASSLYRFIGNNSIPHIKKNGKLIFERSAIIAWLKEGKRKSPAEIDASADRHLAGNKKKNHD